MANQETLQTTNEIMDKKLDSQKAELDQQIGQQLNLLIENYFDPKFNLLIERQQLIMEKLKALDILKTMSRKPISLKD